MTSDYPALKNENCCLFDPQGRLVWVSPALGLTRKSYLGFGYLEFVHHEDSFALLAWIMSPNTEPIVCRCMMPQNGAKVTARYAKFPYNGNWMVVGAHVPGWVTYRTLTAMSLALTIGAGVASTAKLGGCLVAMSQ